MVTDLLLINRLHDISSQYNKWPISTEIVLHCDLQSLNNLGITFAIYGLFAFLNILMHYY